LKIIEWTSPAWYFQNSSGILPVTGEDLRVLVVWTEILNQSLCGMGRSAVLGCWLKWVVYFVRVGELAMVSCAIPR